MPRRSEGPHLKLEAAEYDEQGRRVRNESWVIRDGQRKKRTGCGPEDRAGAERALAEYLSQKHDASRERAKNPSDVYVSDVLNIYLQDKAAEIANPRRTAQRIGILLDWWGERTLADVNGKSCRDYAKSRIGQQWRSAKPEKTGKAPRLVTAAGARRELEDMRAAINYHYKEGLCSHLVSVTLPPRSPPKGIFLTRSEAAKLLWTAWRAQEVQQGRETKKWTSKHIARFILVGLYSGSRHDAICGASFQPAEDRGWVDLEKGIFNRLRQGRRQTKKRQPPVRLPKRLLAHLRRWHRLSIANHAVVEFQGAPVASVSKGFEAIVKRAGIEKHVTPHTLRHTSATWLMQEGKDVWTTAGFLGTSVQMLEQTYAKHHPDYQADVLDAFASPGRKPGQ